MTSDEMEWGGKPMSVTVRKHIELRRAADAGGGCCYLKEQRAADRHAYLNDEQICVAYLELLAKLERLRSTAVGRDDVLEEVIEAVENVFLALACADVALMRLIREAIRSLKGPTNAEPPNTQGD